MHQGGPHPPWAGWEAPGGQEGAQHLLRPDDQGRRGRPLLFRNRRSKQPRKCFHNFRTTMVSKMQSLEITQEVRMNIVGHTSAGVHKGYNQAKVKIT